MHIVVCVKQIIDPELPPGDFEIDSLHKKAVQGKAALVISTFDENAIELALQLREKLGRGKVTVLTYGSDTARDSLYKALAMQADEAVLIREESGYSPDFFATARLLAGAVKKLEPADLIMCGRQAGDWDAGQVGSLLAEELNLPCTTFVCKIESAGDAGLRLRRQVDAGMEIVESPLPSLITVTNDESNVPRIPKVRDVMRAQNKKINTWSLADLGLDISVLDPAGARVQIKDLYVPVQEVRCEFVGGEDGDQKAAALIEKLLRLKIL